MSSAGGAQRPGFVPARSKLEAVTRISALTHSPPQTLGPGSKERKSALTDLANGLGFEVDARADKVALGAQIARHLSVDWTPACWSTGQTVTLVGLNALLAGGEQEIWARAAQAARGASTSSAFIPARGKLEAVTRISALTHSAPESLGPGSKERKSVLINLAHGLGLTQFDELDKVALGRQIADELSIDWTQDCWSTGHTITLVGLNALLGAAEARLRAGSRSVGDRLFERAIDEAHAILEVLAEAVPGHMDGRTCVELMKQAESSNWAQDEWAGFYFEFVGLPALVNAFGGGPAQFANTRFDYALGEVWDLKLHAARSDVAPLNAIDAVRACLQSGQGLGFIVLSGDPTYDNNGAFRAWQQAFKIEGGRKSKPRTEPARYRRHHKSAFAPSRLDVYFIEDEQTLESAIETRAISVLAQGRQASGGPRRPKFQLSFKRATQAGLLIASRAISASAGRLQI